MTTTAMGLLLKNYKELFVERRDERSAQLPLAGSPPLILGLVVAYLCFVLRWGPRYMSNRKPYDLRNIIKAYNLFQVIANSILFLRIFYNVFVQYNEFSFHCQLIDYSRSQRGMDEVFFSYAYFGLKLLDLADTIFFVLRKKQSHVSFLHVYHHSLMVITTYCGLIFVPGGHVLMLGLWNTLVHAVMYFYYFLTSLGTSKNNIWWKKHLTRLQLIQFIHIAFHFGRPLLSGDCQFPTFWLLYGFLQAIFVLALFLDFYLKAYSSQQTKVVVNYKLHRSC